MNRGSEAASRPAPGTLEGWALAYLTATDLAAKFELDEPPQVFEAVVGAACGSPPGPGPSRAPARPVRPPGLVVTRSRRKTPGPVALQSAPRRAELMHTFLHHELQAAELFCWAILAYPQAPRPFRLGLAKIARDEVRHMTMYRDYLAELGCSFGQFPVRDWFWERVPSARTPAEFVATLGMGFEAANLDHTRRFAARFRAVGDEEGARLAETIFEEEIPHVRFAERWFRAFAGESDFGVWMRHLPAPLSPMLMKGDPVERAGRVRSGLSEAFVAELVAWQSRDRAG